MEKVVVGTTYQGVDANGKKVVGVIEKELTNTFIVVDSEMNRYIICKKQSA